jgi:hypothetical protein
MSHKARARPSWKKSKKARKPLGATERDSSQRS